MKESKSAKIGLIIIAVWAGIIVLSDLLQQDRRFSENENRLLAQEPELTLTGLLEGSFMQAYEQYMSDQFIGRDVWIRLKTYGEKYLGKQEINGIYLLEGERLVQRMEPSVVTKETEERKREQLMEELAGLKQAVTGDCYLMLVPGAAELFRDALPPHAAEYDQKGFLDRVREHLPKDVVWVDVETELKKGERERLYYRLDHHWTTEGAFYGYQALRKAWGKAPAEPSEYVVEQVSEDFLGTLHSRLNLPMKGDIIETYTRKKEQSHRVEYVYEGVESSSLYEDKHLRTKDQYAFFLDGNHPLIIITTEAQHPSAEDASDETQFPGEERKSGLLVIKNSYANCLIPFLTEDYTTVYVIDPRYYHADLKCFVEEKKIEDCLYLYDVPGFLN